MAQLAPRAALFALLLLSAAALSVLPGCGTQPYGPTLSSAAPDRILDLLPADAILFGEQHDSPDHHRIELEAVQALTARGNLAALAIEMAEFGSTTAGLAATTAEADVKQALGWDDAGWPWADYRGPVMAAVRAQVPVIGANVPRDRMRAAMADADLDFALPGRALSAQREAIRAGHCDLLPEAQIAPMTRIQIARDQTMARAIESALAPGKTVLLIAGAGHVRRDLGVPLHLESKINAKVALALVQRSNVAIELEADGGSEAAADLLWTTPALPHKDHCAELRKAS